MISSNQDILTHLELSGIEHNVQDLNALSVDILNYYDKIKADTASLNLDNVTGFKVEDKEYIKIENPDGTYTVLDDNMTPKDFVNQFKDTQNSSVDYKTEDGVQNRQQIITVLKNEKEEAVLDSSTAVDRRELTPQERRDFASIMRTDEAKVNNFLVDTKRNIYINRDTGDTYYVHRNELNQAEVRKVNEVGAETISNDVPVLDENMQEKTVTVENPAEQAFDQMDDYELEYTLNNKFDVLTDEQKKALMNIIEKRKQLLVAQSQTLNNNQIQAPTKQNITPKVKTLTLKDVNKKYSGFTSIVFLCLLTSLYGTFFIIYILLTNGMFK